MIENLTVYHFDKNCFLDESIIQSDAFVLETCQRKLVVLWGNDCSINLKSIFKGPYLKYQGIDAYAYLLRVMTGLESKMIAETEIVQQIKSAYEMYTKKVNHKKELNKIFQHIFKDGKFVRTHFLKNIPKTTYAGVTRQIVKSNATNNRIIILGTGELSESIIRILHKEYKIIVIGRNKLRQDLLHSKYAIENLSWMEFENNLDALLFGTHFFSTLINVANVNNTDYIQNAFISKIKMAEPTQRLLLIDLAEHMPIITPLFQMQNIDKFFCTVGLNEIFEFSSRLEKDSLLKISMALTKIEELSQNVFGNLQFRAENNIQFDKSFLRATL